MKRFCTITGVAAVLAGLACSDAPTSSSDGPAGVTPGLTLPELTLAELTLSNARAGSTAGVSAGTDVGGAGGESVAYVSLPPGTLPHMVSVRIRNVGAYMGAGRMSGSRWPSDQSGPSSPAVAVVDGGFDPVAVAGNAGDELELRFTDARGSASVAYLIIPLRRPPVVVRINPPKGRTDVALRARPVVIFSEPFDPQTLAAGVRLLSGGTAVAASVSQLSGQPWSAELVPAEALAPGTSYELQITTAIQDLDGDALEEPVTATFTTAQSGGPAGLHIVSGTNQPGKAGRELPEPFVVRVTNGVGEAVPEVEVTWTVTGGEGVLDGLWEKCPALGAQPSMTELARPIPTRSVRTDANGLARVSFMPTWFGAVTVTASVGGASGEVHFTTDASDPKATLEIVPGNAGAREPWFWEMMSLQNPPLSVRVKDGQGNVVPNVRVDWRVESGEGLLAGCPSWRFWSGGTTSRTEGDGNAIVQSSARFLARALGPSTVTAAVPGVTGSPVRFKLDATVALIYVDGHLVGRGVFRGPDDHPDVVVPVGTRVEFPVVNPTAHIVSTSSPPGGVSFDSGVLERDWWNEAKEWFGFVPNVAGTWAFVDQVTGATGTVTAR